MIQVTGLKAARSNLQYTEVLFVSPFVPYPLDDGLKIRAYNSIKELLRVGYNVTLLCYAGNVASETNELGNQLGIRIVLVPFRDELGFFLDHAVPLVHSMDPYMVHHYQRREFTKRLSDLIEHSSFDLCYFYSPYLMADAVMVAQKGIPLILDSVDCQSLSMLRGYESSTRLAHKVFWLVNYFKWKRIERKRLKLFDCVLVSAERDIGPLRRILGRRVQTLNNGVDTDYWRPCGAVKERYSMVFAGSMDAFANSMAAVRFVDGIFPLVKERIPQARFYIAGRNPPREVQNLAGHPDVHVLGYVRDLRNLIDRCEVVVCPLRMATGIQTKILEAMAMNKPIVASRISLGDIARFLTDDDVVIVESDKEFAEGIVRLLSNREGLEELGKNGRAIVEKHFAWMTFGERLDDIIVEVMQRDRHGE